MNCANCSEELFDGDAFCTECGTAVADSIPPPESGPDLAQDTAVDSKTSDYSEEPEFGDSTVRRPSHADGGAAVADHSEPAGFPASTTPACENCGEVLEPGAPFCIGCGESASAVFGHDMPTDSVSVTGDSDDDAAVADATDEPGLRAAHVSGAALAEPEEGPAFEAESDVAESCCPFCGERLEDDAAFCTACGASTNTDPEYVEAAVTTAEPEPSERSEPAAADSEGQPCANCGAPLEADSVFCNSCGSQVGILATAAAIADTVPVPSADETIVLPPDTELPSAAASDQASCRNCGASLLAGAEFCTSCGATAVLDDAEAPGTESSSEARSGENGFCIACGHALEGGVQFCVSCGAAREASSEGAPTQVLEDAKCPACSATVLAGSTFCTGCGSVLTPVVEAESGPASTDPIAPPPESPEPAETAEPPSFCIGCGSRMESNDEFCIKCGQPRDGLRATATVSTATQPAPAVLPPVSDQTPPGEARKKRSLVPLWIALAVVAVAVLGWFGLQVIGGEDEAPLAGEEADADREAEGGGPSQTDTTATAGGSIAATPGDLDAAACLVAADGARDATVELALAFSGNDIAGLVDGARIGRQSLPGAGAFDTANAALLALPESAECSIEDRESLYTAAMTSVPDPADPAAALVQSAGAGGFGFDGTDLLTRIAAALRMYPVHGGVVAVATPTGELPRWTVILESLEVGDYTRNEALARAAAYGDRSITADVLNSGDYGSLNPGYWAIYTGMFEDRADATARCSSIRSSVDFCYDRYLQQLPTTTGPNGACGPYGRFSVTGVSSGTNLDVRIGPSSGQNVLGTYSRSATGILAAGPDISIGSVRWTPVEVNGKVGWVESRYLSIESACVGTVPPQTEVTSCPAVAVATTDLLQSIVSAAEAADVSGISAVTGIDMGTYDDIASQLVSDAGGNGCEVAELNDLVSAQYGRISATGPFAELVRDLLIGRPFFNGE